MHWLRERQKEVLDSSPAAEMGDRGTFPKNVSFSNPQARSFDPAWMHKK